MTAGPRLRTSLSALCVAVAAFATPMHALANAPEKAASPSDAQRAAAEDRALGLLRGNAGKARLSTADRFGLRDVIVDADGSEHVRFARSYGGLPVIGGDLVVHSQGGRFKAVSLAQSRPIVASIKPSVDAGEAIVAAGAEFGPDFAGVPQATLTIYARGPGEPRLAWNVRMDGGDGRGNPVEMTYIVDAHSARVLDRWSRIETAKPGTGGGSCVAVLAATGKGRTLYAGEVAIQTQRCGSDPYVLRDPSRGGGDTVDMRSATSGDGVPFTDADNTWGRGSMADRASAGADAHYGMAATWDYFLGVHGRPGIDGMGTAATSRVHYGRDYANAFWSEQCYCISYGDGDGRKLGPMVNLDIAGHEMSHGVTARTAGLVYSGESGALNEATSDIFGTMVEFHANNALDRPDYTIGEEVFINGGGQALRYMFKPSRDGVSSDCWNPDLGTRDVHFGSGVANHFFYLLAEGAVAPAGYAYAASQLVCNGDTAVAGLGRDKAQRIWYRALTVYFTSTTDFAGARVATRQAAQDLYGDAGALAVDRAWRAVGVN
jgi:Zn-dependent metalloprotease